MTSTTDDDGSSSVRDEFVDHFLRDVASTVDKDDKEAELCVKMYGAGPFLFYSRASFIDTPYRSMNFYESKQTIFRLELL